MIQFFQNASLGTIFAMVFTTIVLVGLITWAIPYIMIPLLFIAVIAVTIAAFTTMAISDIRNWR